MDRIVRMILGIFGGLFVWAASLQLNDATAALWGGIYGGAALVCLGAALGFDLPASASGVGAVGALAYAAWLGWRIQAGDVTAMYDDASAEELKLVALKEGREMLGLLIVAAALGLHAGWRWNGSSLPSEEA